MRWRWRSAWIARSCRRRGFEDLEAVGQSVPAVSSEELRKYLEDLGDDDLGKYKM